MSTSSYRGFLNGLVGLLEEARRFSARSVNAVMTATYWEIGRRIVDFEQEGKAKAAYGERLIDQLARDLSGQFGRGFSRRNLFQIRLFYLTYQDKVQTVSAQLGPVTAMPLPVGKVQTLSAESGGAVLSRTFPLPWSHYVRLLTVGKPQARAFYEAEALRGGWSVRQLDRQISTRFYERTALSRDKGAMLKKDGRAKLGEALSPEEEIKDPLVLEFLGLKDEYSESALEEALIRHLEQFLLELGNDFTFVARQKRLRVGDEWYRLDLLFFHRRLRCLSVIDLKICKFTHADAGQMNLYLNYAREHWTHHDENPPVGLILCAKGDEAVAHYALGNLHNKVLAREYQLILPEEKRLVEELERTQQILAGRMLGPARKDKR